MARDAAIAVDIGGTFTDVTLFDRASGRLWNAKTPSTPHDPSIGFIDGVAAALKTSGLTAEEIGQVIHGTTVATNMILEGNGARAALVTTRGFKHVLEIGRHDIPRKSNLYSWVKPRRPVPPQHVYEVAGRLDQTGAELTPLDEAGLRAVARQIRAAGIEAIAVCFIHAYANPAHERRAREILAEEHPAAMVSLSAEVLPVFREYERSMTTILNVYVMPRVASYVAKLEERLAGHGIAAPLLLMKSSGGVTGTETIRREPVQTALSGPAAGAMGAAFVGLAAGFRDVISIDIGGTSADICLIKGGEPGVTVEGKVGDWPLPLPMIDIHTIGAGGGSIAAIAESGALTVGPRSAGADPGPVAYVKGGVEPTVTDAHLALGRLPPYLLEGGLTLDRDGAIRAIRERVARPLGLDVSAAARGILAVLENNMAGAIRIVSVERGYDPRDFALVPFGGAGPLHGSALARLLGIKTIVVPPAPGVLSALGLLVSSLKSDHSRTFLQRPPDYDLAGIGAVFAELERDAATWLEREGAPPEGRAIVRQASMRYVHQGFELTAPWPAGAVDAAALQTALGNFHRLHERLYTFAQEDTPVEIVTLRVSAIGRLPTPSLPRLPAGGAPDAAIIGRQDVDFDGAPTPCPVYDRTKLGHGDRIAGPAILRQLDTTTLVMPGQTGTVDAFGNLIVTES